MWFRLFQVKKTKKKIKVNRITILNWKRTHDEEYPWGDEVKNHWKKWFLIIFLGYLSFYICDGLLSHLKPDDCTQSRSLFHAIEILPTQNPAPTNYINFMQIIQLARFELMMEELPYFLNNPLCRSQRRRRWGFGCRAGAQPEPKPKLVSQPFAY